MVEKGEEGSDRSKGAPQQGLGLYDRRRCVTSVSPKQCMLRVATDRFGLMVVLGSLLSRSFKEDTYGTVQRDVPRVLEAMVQYLSALEEYQTELVNSVPALPSEDEEHKLSASETTDGLLVHMEVSQASEWVDGLAKGMFNFRCFLFMILKPRLM